MNFWKVSVIVPIGSSQVVGLQASPRVRASAPLMISSPVPEEHQRANRARWNALTRDTHGNSVDPALLTAFAYCPASSPINRSLTLRDRSAVQIEYGCPHLSNAPWIFK
jgi:hypothetical protein